MNFIDKLFHRSEPEPVADIQRSHSTGQFLPSYRERHRRANEAIRRMEMEVMKAVTPPEQFAEAVKRGSTREAIQLQRGAA
jgi:hypothetical protein